MSNEAGRVDSVDPIGAARFSDLVPGRRYRVTFGGDVYGHFDAVFVRLDWIDDDEGGELMEAAVFNTARIGPSWEDITWVEAQ